MNAEPLQRMRRLESVALGLAVVAGVAAVVIGWRWPAGWIPAWRLAGFACLQPALGSIIFILIYRSTGGQWMKGLTPFLMAGARLLPWVWLVILPLVCFPPTPPQRNPATQRFEAGPDREASAALAQVFSEDGRQMDPTLRAYFSRPMFAGRAVAYGVIFFLLLAGAIRSVDDPERLRMRWFGPVGLIGVVFLLHLLSTDWLLLLDPGWYSTGFPLVWTCAQAISGLSAAVAASLYFGAEPAKRGPTGQPLGLDWGNLMLASIMAWTYVAFVELLIIWSGNQPAETAWYLHRSAGGWRLLEIGLGALEFGAPFFLLLSRGTKRRRSMLGGVAVLLLAGQLGYTIWLIAPEFPRLGAATGALEAAVLLAAGALFVNRYLAASRRHWVALP